MQTLACPSFSHVRGHTDTLANVPSASGMCRAPSPLNHLSPLQNHRMDAPGASSGGCCPSSFGVVKFEFLSSYLLPLQGLVLVQSLLPSFPTHLGRSGQALPCHILQTLPSLALAAPLRDSASSSLTTWSLKVGFFMAFTSLCYFISIFLSCSMISPTNTSHWVPLAAASAQEALHSQHTPCWVPDFPATRLRAVSVDMFPFPLMFYLPWFHPPAQSLVPPPHLVPRPAPPL